MANPIVAAIASFIIPGIGQIYAGDMKKGIVATVHSLIMMTISKIP